MVTLHPDSITDGYLCQYERGREHGTFWVLPWPRHRHGICRLGRDGRSLQYPLRRTARRSVAYGCSPRRRKRKSRRGFRVARRRLERREQRLAMLRDIFAKAVAAVDPAFFQRMEESRFWAEDKRPDGEGRPLGRYTLFADRDYCDRDYHREFPTIYHLRRALMFEDRAFDVRLVYLAVHHILKKRGHFLFGDVALEDVTFGSCLEALRAIPARRIRPSLCARGRPGLCPGADRPLAERHPQAGGAVPRQRRRRQGQAGRRRHRPSRGQKGQRRRAVRRGA